jgi:hypothetical protein
MANNIQWVTINGKHIPLGADTGAKIPEGALGDKAKEYIQSEQYAKLGALFAEHRGEFGLNKKEDAYIKAYQVIKNAHKNSDEDKKDKEIAESKEKSDKLTFEKRLENLNDKNTMYAKLGNKTYIVEKDTVRVKVDEKPNGQPLYARRYVYTVKELRNKTGNGNTHFMKQDKFDKFLSSSGATSKDWKFMDKRLTTEEQWKIADS